MNPFIEENLKNLSNLKPYIIKIKNNEISSIKKQSFNLKYKSFCDNCFQSLSLICIALPFVIVSR